MSADNIACAMHYFVALEFAGARKRRIRGAAILKQ
jgi:hypothetical protein